MDKYRTEIECRDEYELYTRLLANMCGKLGQFYGLQTKGGNHEARVTEIFAKKLLNTVNLLRMKYLFNPAHSLKVDLHDSGFPSFLEINNILTDLLGKREKLVMLPKKEVLKQKMLDQMMKNYERPEDHLWHMSEREYFENLHEDEVFLPFTPGTLELIKEDREHRHYAYSWACFDFRTNRPYVYVLMFDQDKFEGSDKSISSFEEDPVNFGHFLEFIKGEGSRAPVLGALAYNLDNQFKHIHPKILKRVCIGPMYTEKYGAGHKQLSKLLKKLNGEKSQHFVLLFENEIVFSEAQKTSRGIFSFGQAREIFKIPVADQECYERKISGVNKYMLIPHLLHQEFNKGLEEEFEEFNIITYGEKGDIL